MPDTYLDRLSEGEKAESWRHNLLKHGPSGRKRVWVALNNTGINGFVRVGSVVLDKGEVGLISLVYVLPEQWDQNVGATLMQAGMQELRDLNMPEVTLWVLRDNLCARRFYEGFGWVPDGETGSESGRCSA